MFLTTPEDQKLPSVAFVIQRNIKDLMRSDFIFQNVCTD
jgi:hypothetical protein